MRRDRGFTLVEVLIVVSILGLLVGILATALRVSVHAGSQSMGALDLSHDAELLGHVLGDDLANANVVDTNAATCVAAPMLRLEIGGEIAYRIDADHSLVRVECASGAERVVARFLGAATPTVVCTPSCGASATRVRLDIPLCARLGESDRCDPMNTRTIRVIGRPRAA